MYPFLNGALQPVMLKFILNGKTNFNNIFYSEKLKEEQITTDYTKHLKKQQNNTKTSIAGVLYWSLDFT